MRAKRAGREAHDGFRQSSNPDNPLGKRNGTRGRHGRHTGCRQAILREPAQGTRQEPGDGPRHEGDIDNDHQHQIDRTGASNLDTRQHGLYRQRHRDGEEHPRRLHSLPSGVTTG